MGIKINGKNITSFNQTSGITANSISINGNTVRINGKIIDLEEFEGNTLHIKVEGVLASLECDGSVECGDISGNVIAGGSVHCKNVKNNVQATGSVHCENVGGNVSAIGSVNMKR